MLQTYASLVKGEGCVSFYTSGKCPRICSFSLNSILTRSSWTRCARRCDWSPAFIESAHSWLRMCNHNLAPEQPAMSHHQLSNDSLHHTLHASGDDASSRIAPLRPSSIIRVVVPLTMLLAIVSALACSLSPALNARFQRIAITFRATLHRCRQALHNRRGTTPVGKGPLDIGPDRSELRNLQRGARRHLKSLQSTLD